MPDDPSADLAGIKERQALASDANLGFSRMNERHDALIKVAYEDTPRLLAAIEAALKDHRKSMLPARPPGAGNAHGKHYCAGICYTSIDHQTVYRVWPCQPYLDITRALLGEDAL